MSVDEILELSDKITPSDEEIDFSDIPEITEEQWATARPYYPRKVIGDKKYVMFEVDKDVAEHIESLDDWRSKVNDLLKNAIAVGQI